MLGRMSASADGPESGPALPVAGRGGFPEELRLCSALAWTRGRLFSLSAC